MRRQQSSPRRRDEADGFRMAMLRLRDDAGWTQQDLARRLGISKRTLSHWENAHWLPPFKQRLHIVVSLHDVPPEHVLEVADALGVSVHPAVAPLLKPYRDAVQPEGSVVAPPAPVAPPPEPERPRSSPEQLRAAMDVIVRDSADAMNVLANDLRAAIDRALAASEAMGGTLADAREALKARSVKGKSA